MSVRTVLPNRASYALADPWPILGSSPTEVRYAGPNYPDRSMSARQWVWFAGLSVLSVLAGVGDITVLNMIGLWRLTGH